MRCFHSKAGADVLMLNAHADAVLPLFGREATAEGVFLYEQIAEALKAYADFRLPAADEALEGEVEDDSPDLARRAWPLLDLLRRAQAQGHPVIWTST
jgi:hypothetical protein